MNKVLKAFTKIKTVPDQSILRDLNMCKNDMDRVKANKVLLIRNEKELKAKKEILEKKMKENSIELTKTEQNKIQEEITKIYTLPIRDLKVVRGTSKTGYLPKILITTGLIKLAKFDPAITSEAEFFTRYVGRELGRFLIQYDWSPKHNGPKISMVNLTQQLDGYQSATIKYGIPCLGNISDMVYEMFEKKEFFKLTETLLDYLENAIYGTPYVAWDRFYDRNNLQTWNNVKQLVFQDYMSTNNEVETKVIESMIPKKELEILKRDTSKDFQYPYLSFMGQETHPNCHCEQCLALRRRFQLFLKFEEEHKDDIVPTATTQTVNTEEQDILNRLLNSQRAQQSTANAATITYSNPF